MVEGGGLERRLMTNTDTSELDEAQEVLRVALPARDQASVVVKPGKEPLDLPTPFGAPQGTTVLRDVASIPAVRGDQLDLALPEEPLVQGVAVVGPVADQPANDVGEKRVVESLFDEGDLVRRSTCNANGDWKTDRVCDRHDLGSLAALRLSDGRAPFLAPAKEPSMNASETSISPRSYRSSASA